MLDFRQLYEKWFLFILNQLDKENTLKISYIFNGSIIIDGFLRGAFNVYNENDNLTYQEAQMSV